MTQASSIQTFSLELPDWPGMLAGNHPVEGIERALLERLPGCGRLIRWAVVSVDELSGQYRCEGAYLSSVRAATAVGRL